MGNGMWLDNDMTSTNTYELTSLHGQLDAVTRQMVAAIRRGDLAAAKGYDAKADELADRIVASE